MMKLINNTIKELNAELKRAEEFFEETDCSETMHKIEHLKFTIQRFKTFKKEAKAKLAEE